MGLIFKSIFNSSAKNTIHVDDLVSITLLSLPKSFDHFCRAAILHSIREKDWRSMLLKMRTPHKQWLTVNLTSSPDICCTLHLWMIFVLWVTRWVSFDASLCSKAWRHFQDWKNVVRGLDSLWACARAVRVAVCEWCAIRHYHQWLIWAECLYDYIPYTIIAYFPGQKNELGLNISISTTASRCFVAQLQVWWLRSSKEWLWKGSVTTIYLCAVCSVVILFSHGL